MRVRFRGDGVIHDPAAERAALGAVLIAAPPAAEILAEVRGHEFRDPRHRKIAGAIRIAATRGSTVDVETVRAELVQAGQLADAGGIAYLAGLVDGVPKSDRWRSYLEPVRRLAWRRAVQHRARQLSDAANNGHEDADLSAEIEALGTLAHPTAGGTLVALDLSREPEPTPELVRGVIPAGGRVLVAAPSGTGKSWLALDLVLSIVTGDPWLGLDEHRIASNDGPALIVEEEASAGALHHRLARLARGRGLDLAAPEVRERIVAYAGQGVHLADARRWGALVDEARRRRPCLVVLDPAIRMLPGSDSDSEAVAAFWRGVGELQREGGCAVLVTHHAGWIESNRPRGSTDWRAAVDVEIDLGRGETRDVLKVAWGKVRDGIQPSPMWVRLDYEGDTVRLHYEGAVEGERLTGRDLEVAVLRFVGNGPDGHRDRGDLLSEFCPDGRGVRTLDRAVARLKREGALRLLGGQYAAL